MRLRDGRMPPAVKQTGKANLKNPKRIPMIPRVTEVGTCARKRDR